MRAESPDTDPHRRRMITTISRILPEYYWRTYCFTVRLPGGDVSRSSGGLVWSTEDVVVCFSVHSVQWLLLFGSCWSGVVR